MANVFCRNCGKSISDIAVICTNCGVATGYKGQKFSNGLHQQEPKSVGLAFLFTFLFPGAGHLYIGKSEKATPYLIASAIGFVCAFTLVLFPIALIIWLVTFIMLAPKISEEVNEINERLM